MGCPYCGSEKIEVGVAWGKAVETGNVGLKYESGFLVGVVQVYSDLCLNCGSLLRSYIKDSTPRQWCKRPGSLGSV
ncbi:MAG: hypothetical protein AAGU32_18105 [Bacillota bacterium]